MLKLCPCGEGAVTPAACVREEVAGLLVRTLRRKEQREPRVLGAGAGAGRAGWLSDGHGAGLVLTTVGPGSPCGGIPPCPSLARVEEEHTSCYCSCRNPTN